MAHYQIFAFFFLFQKDFDFYHELFLHSFCGLCSLDPTCFLIAPGSAWQAVLKKTKVKLNLLTHIDMLLMVGKRIRGGICHSNIEMQQLVINI